MQSVLIVVGGKRESLLTMQTQQFDYMTCGDVLDIARCAGANTPKVQRAHKSGGARYDSDCYLLRM